MRYVIYTRVSTDKQTVDNQIKECQEYVDKIKAIDDQVIHLDEPETSSRIPMDERVKLKEMIDNIQRGDTLVIYKLDRLARDGEELVYIYRSKLIKRGVKVVSLYEPHIDNANIHIYAFLAETERNNIRIRTVSGLKRKQAKMEKVGTTWYGYKTDPEKIQNHKPDCHSFGKPYLLIPDSNEQAQVELMVQCRSQGMSYQEIADTLLHNGYLNRKGNPVIKTTVHKVLTRLGKNNPVPLS
jgi:putative DNA-invertase from lambdoid prophage Rac